MRNQKSNFLKFILLWAGELISAVGSGLTSFGLGVYVFQKTGSAGSMALVTLLAFLPTLLLSVSAGQLLGFALGGALCALVLIPLAVLGTAALAVWLGVTGIINIKAYECCMGKE